MQEMWSLYGAALGWIAYLCKLEQIHRGSLLWRPLQVAENWQNQSRPSCLLWVGLHRCGVHLWLVTSAQHHDFSAPLLSYLLLKRWGEAAHCRAGKCKICVVAPRHGPAEEMGERAIGHHCGVQAHPWWLPPPKWLEPHAGHQRNRPG